MAKAGKVCTMKDHLLPFLPKGDLLFVWSFPFSSFTVSSRKCSFETVEKKSPAFFKCKFYRMPFHSISKILFLFEALTPLIF